MTPVRKFVAWGALGLLVSVPVLIAALSPFHAYRSASYIAASLAGVLALALLLVQPLLMDGRLLGMEPARLRRWHQRLGAVLVALVAIHVVGLLIANPPDAIDALLLRSPTPFSVWGVIAMWAVALTAALVMLRRKLRLRPATWAAVHNALALVVVVGTVIHALQIVGTMGTLSKWARLERSSDSRGAGQLRTTQATKHMNACPFGHGSQLRLPGLSVIMVFGHH